MARRTRPVPPPLHYLAEEAFRNTLAHDFVREIMLVFIENPGERLRPVQENLRAALQRVERANALLYQDAFDKYERLQAEEASKSEEERDHIPEPEAPELKLISKADIDSERDRANEKPNPTLEIYAAIPTFKELYRLATAVKDDYLVTTTSMFKTSLKHPTPIGKAIQELLDNTFPLARFVDHVDNDNKTSSAMEGMVKGIREQMRKEAKKTDRLAGKVDELNETVVGMKDQNATLILRVADLNETMAGLNETLMGYSRMETSFGGAAAPSRLFGRDKHVDAIKKALDYPRWNCILSIANELKITHHDAPSNAPLLDLLQNLLIPLTDMETAEKDRKVALWLAEHHESISPELAKQLTLHTELEPLTLPEDSKPKEYFLAIAYCFRDGKMFPKNMERATAFNQLRQQCKKEKTTHTVDLLT